MIYIKDTVNCHDWFLDENHVCFYELSLYSVFFYFKKTRKLPENYCGMSVKIPTFVTPVKKYFNNQFLWNLASK